jgi:hypothetical protein
MTNHSAQERLRHNPYVSNRATARICWMTTEGLDEYVVAHADLSFESQRGRDDFLFYGVTTTAPARIGTPGFDLRPGHGTEPSWPGAGAAGRNHCLFPAADQDKSCR